MFNRLLTAALLCSSIIFPALAQDVPPPIPPAQAVKGDNGLSWTVTADPKGTSAPSARDFVTLDYTGWNAAGDVFDSTSKHPALRIFAVSALFPGLRQTVTTMHTGEKRRVWIPAALAPKGAPIVMDVELLDISNPFLAPSDVAAPPATAEKSKSGLAWVVLKPGSGSGHPRRSSWVTVNYTGWTTDGQMFDSSYTTGQASSFNLGQVIPGWTEGLQSMVPGEQRRFWIPEKLAYHRQPGMPAGMLVFDIELVKFR